MVIEIKSQANYCPISLTKKESMYNINLLYKKSCMDDLHTLATISIKDSQLDPDKQFYINMAMAYYVRIYKQTLYVGRKEFNLYMTL